MINLQKLISNKKAFTRLCLLVITIGIVSLLWLFSFQDRTYINNELGLGFRYPHDWGNVEIEYFFNDVDVKAVLSFEKQPDIQFLSQTNGFWYSSDIFTSSPYEPTSPRDFCSRYVRCGESSSDVNCRIADCVSTPPYIFHLSQTSSGSLQEMTVSKRYFFPLQGTSFSALTGIVNIQTWAQGAGSQYPGDLMLEKEKIAFAFANKDLAQTVDTLMRGVHTFKPKNQDDWYMDLVRSHLGLPLNPKNLPWDRAAELIGSSSSSSVPALASGSLLVLSPTSKWEAVSLPLTVTGVAGADIETIEVQTLCEPQIKTSGWTLRRPDGLKGEWHWSYEIAKEQACLGANSVMFITDVPCGNYRCKPRASFSYISKESPLHPRSVRLLSGERILPDAGSGITALETATKIIFKGVAGPEVSDITVGQSNCAGEPGRFYRPLYRPDDAEWHWEYILENTANICRGMNHLQFYESPLNKQAPCNPSTCVDFWSKVGYLPPNELLFYDEPSSNIGTIHAKEMVFSGLAGSQVIEIEVDIRCMDTELSFSKKIIPQRQVGRDELEWTLRLSAEEKTLCLGQNDVTIRPIVSKNPPGESHSFYFQSLGGFLPANRQLDAEKILQYKKGPMPDIQNQRSPLEMHVNNSSLKNFCKNDPYGLEDGDDQFDGWIPGALLTSSYQLDSDVSVHLRWKKESELESQTWDRATAILEFISKKGDKRIPPPKFVAQCNTSIAVYYFRPDRIIIDLGAGFETPNAILIWDGEKWRYIGDLVPINNPAAMGAANDQMFIIRETGGCCDIYTPTYLDKWSEFLIDVETLDILNVRPRSQF